MTKRHLHVNWKAVDGAAKKKRILHLRPNDEGTFICPIQGCLHVVYKSIRGLRKHVNAIHPWYYFFDVQPAVPREDAVEATKKKLKITTHKIPSFSIDEGVGKDFTEWLQSSTGGGKSKKEAVQAARRAMKFLRLSMDEPYVSICCTDFVDCCIGSPSIVINFLKILTDDWEIGSSGALGYMKAMGDVMDFRKASGVSDNVLRNFICTEVYIRRGKDNLSKAKKLEYARNLDLETLIARDSWASLQDMERVIPYHTPKYEHVLQKCHEKEEKPSASDLSFATRFIATFLFLRVKCTRPMTIQFITLDMIDTAKTNGGYIDQTTFKTHERFIFDTLILSADVVCILDTYISTIRPLCQPACEYLLVTTNGNQYRAFGTAMSLLVHQAIGKSINPTRYRQIIESQSALELTPSEQDVISKDQKHSSGVAKRIYQKRLSRDVATEGRACIIKMVGSEGIEHTKTLAASMAITVPPSVSDEPPSITIDDSEQHTSANESAADVIDVTPAPDPNDELQCPIEVLRPDESKIEDDILEISTAETDATEVEIENGPIASTSSAARGGCALITSNDIEVKKEDLENEIARGTRMKRFTFEEDIILKKGIKKHGLGKWSRILNDPEFSFHQGRTRDTLRMRADTLGLSNKKTAATKKVAKQRQCKSLK